MANDETLFQKIIKREIPANVVYEDDLCLAFCDIDPQAPHHILLIPKKHIPKLSDSLSTDKELLGHLLLTANKIALEQEFIGDGFRLVINNGEKSGQTVFHLHIHILAGRPMKWPPG